MLYNKKYAGEVTVPNNPIQIADAALYLSKTQPGLGITDPYELTQPQFTATVNLLKQQKPLIKKYWDLASQEISLFQSGTTVVGAAWPYQTNTLVAAGAKVGDTIPAQGATGWADTWMLATKAPHPNCAYKWMQWATTPKVQAQQAVFFGETPANKLACPIMDQISKGSCAAYHANAPEAVLPDPQVLEDPAGAVRQRQERLRAVPAVGHRPGPRSRGGPTEVAATAGRRPVRARRGVSAALWRRAWLRGTPVRAAGLGSS